MTVSFEYDFDRALAAMVYIATKGVSDLDKYKICKLIFLADKLHLVRYSRPITGDVICAMQHGPVPSQTLNILNDLIAEDTRDTRVSLLQGYLEVERKYYYPRFTARQTLDFEEYLSQSDIQALEETLHKHGKKTFDELKALTHEMPSYIEAWGSRDCNNPRMRFETLFVEDSDAIQGALEEMVENDELRNAFGVTTV
jgi:uncharacterized phage-associated protein